MKTEIRKTKHNCFRACYTLDGSGECTVPFDTEAEAKAFLKGVRHAVCDIEDNARLIAAKAKLKTIPQHAHIQGH